MKDYDRFARVSRGISRLCSFVIGLALFVVAPFMPEEWTIGWPVFALLFGAVLIAASFDWGD